MKAHQTSARYDSGISEFDAVGFSEEYLGNCKAPFVKEAFLKIAMKLEDKIEMKINGTLLIIGSIQFIDLDDHLVNKDGFVNLSGADVLLCAGLDAYLQSQLIGRLGYAKPGIIPKLI